MKLQQLLSRVRKAVDDYHMIEDGDKIAIGISGGKDSLTLLEALHSLRFFYPKKFEICAITVDLGFHNVNLDKIVELCEKRKIEYRIVPTEIAKIIFEDRKETNPCSLCAKMRKGALNTIAKELGCNKIAYAHHKDDIVETMMMSLIFEGRFHTFAPVTYLDRMDLTVIRPLAYLNEADVIGFVNKNNVPVVKSACPTDGYTKRQYVKDLLKQLNQENPGVKNRMFTAIQSGNLQGWQPFTDAPSDTQSETYLVE
ncbi:MAG: tRNA 2-thiocytidine(32) synthetase TtcA [Acetatifactor sp.]|nr:tRNA 2-thiocytidine(32) synthetase TtcA [Acetatifactor sp.]